MKKLIGRLMLALAGWKFSVTLKEEDYKKCVLVCAPHTSNWDFYFCIACFWSAGIPFKVFIKDNYTRPWYGFIFRSLGCIGVNRTKRNNLVEHAVEIINNSERMAMINTPEGTRSWSKRWKKGFYYIAKEANVPIVLAYGDYKNKIAGIEKRVDVGDRSFEDVLQEIQDFYKPEMAKYPENYNPKIY